MSWLKGAVLAGRFLDEFPDIMPTNQGIAALSHCSDAPVRRRGVVLNPPFPQGS